MRKDILKEWRNEHREELDKTLAVLVSIRDNEDETGKNRIEAGKAIARMLGGLAPEKVAVPKQSAVADKADAPGSSPSWDSDDEIERLLESLK